MTKLIWDAIGEHFYEMGTRKGVLYVQEGNAYPKGVVWNGLTAVTESPEGAEPTDLWADDIKYGTIRSAETFGCTIEAYTYPKEFEECDGSKEVAKGVVIGQQGRKAFGFSYVSQIGNDTSTESDDGYKLHLIYGATASPSEKSYATMNDSPDAITFSWEIDTTPVGVTGHKPVSTIIINSLETDPAKLAALEAILYGTDDAEPRLPLPDEVITLMADTPSVG